MAGDKLFYYQILVLYGIIDLVILYLTFSGTVTSENRIVLYSLFIFLLAYSIFGLWLFINEVSSNYGLSKTSITFTDKSGGNIQNLTSWGLILVNLIAIGSYLYSMMKPVRTGSQGGGRRNKY